MSLTAIFLITLSFTVLWYGLEELYEVLDSVLEGKKKNFKF
ncbi:hypothetical protein [Thermovibrio ammonificans]